MVALVVVAVVAAVVLIASMFIVGLRLLASRSCCVDVVDVADVATLVVVVVMFITPARDRSSITFLAPKNGWR